MESCRDHGVDFSDKLSVGSGGKRVAEELTKVGNTGMQLVLPAWQVTGTSSRGGGRLSAIT